MAILSLDELDANILYGIVNEKLRLECDSIDDLLLEFEVDKHEFEQKIEQAGFYYDPLINQLKIK